jgi:hypothetical protein
MDLFSGKVVLITGGLGSGGGRPLPLLAETGFTTAIALPVDGGVSA